MRPLRARSSNSKYITRPLFKIIVPRLNYSATPGPNIMATKYEPPYYPPIIFPSMFLQPRCPVCTVFPLCRTHISSLGHSNGVFQVVNGILFQNWTLAKTIPVAVQPVPFTSHLLFFFPCFLFTTKTKLRRYPVDETIGGIVEKPQRIVLGRHGR